MTKYLVIDKRERFTGDVEFGIQMEGDGEHEAVCLNSADNIRQAVSMHGADYVVMAQNVMETTDLKADYGAPKICYAQNDNGLALASRYGIPCYGKVTDGQALARKLMEETPSIPDAPASERREAGEPSGKEEKAEKPSGTEKAKKPGTLSEMRKAAGGKKEKPRAKQREAGDEAEETQREEPAKKPSRREPEPRPYEETYEEDDRSSQGLPVIEFDYAGDDEDDDDGEDERNEREERAQREKERERRGEMKRPEPPERKTSSGSVMKYTGRRDRKGRDDIDREIDDDLGRNRPAKIVTVFSAKGGVGKTTISTELATYLSLVTVGPDKLRVALVDYNIDFGDVRVTLGITTQQYSLTYFAAEVEERLKNGKDPKKLNFTRDEIESFMTRTDTGLYVLPAPLTNQDSSKIRSEWLEVILRNIRDNGDFDYVVCDTGNNTRDSTMTAVYMSDLLLLLVDQNLNTAVCDSSFYETMKTVGYDMANAKLIINRVMPEKTTRISVNDLTNHFPFECIGQIDFSTSVIKATNLGTPLVSSEPNHDFTKQLRQTVSYILGNNEFETQEKKTSLFGRLFRKKK